MGSYLLDVRVFRAQEGLELVGEVEMTQLRDLLEEVLEEPLPILDELGLVVAERRLAGNGGDVAPGPPLEQDDPQVVEVIVAPDGFELPDPIVSFDGIGHVLRDLRVRDHDVDRRLVHRWRLLLIHCDIE